MTSNKCIIVVGATPMCKANKRNQSKRKRGSCVGHVELGYRYPTDKTHDLDKFEASERNTLHPLYNGCIDECCRKLFDSEFIGYTT